jgi:hypothetical protein
MDSNRYSYLLSVKRGIKWSDRRVEITNEIFQYLDPSNLNFLSYLIFRDKRIEV